MATSTPDFARYLNVRSAYGPSFTQSDSRPAVKVVTESRSMHTLGLPAGLPDGQ